MRGEFAMGAREMVDETFHRAKMDIAVSLSHHSREQAENTKENPHTRPLFGT